MVFESVIMPLRNSSSINYLLVPQSTIALMVPHIICKRNPWTIWCVGKELEASNQSKRICIGFIGEICLPKLAN